MATKKSAPKMTEAQDKRMDQRAGLKEGSAKDNADDRRRGVPVRKGR